MDNTIVVCLLSGVISLIVSLCANSSERYLIKRKYKKQEINTLIKDNKIIFKYLLNISNEKEINYYDLNQKIKSAPELFFLLPTDIINLFEDLQSLLNLKGMELVQKKDEIKSISVNIINKVREVGVEASELNK